MSNKAYDLPEPPAGQSHATLIKTSAGAVLCGVAGKRFYRWQLHFGNGEKGGFQAPFKPLWIFIMIELLTLKVVGSVI